MHVVLNVLCASPCYAFAHLHHVVTHALYVGLVFCHGKPENTYHLLKLHTWGTVRKCIHIMHHISISSWHHNEHIVPTFFRYHIPASHFAWVIASSCICVQHTFCSTHCIPFVFMFAYAWSLHFPLQNKNKKEAWKFTLHSSCICLVPWANHVGIINPFLKKNQTKWLSMVPNVWLTRKWCFFGHLNSIITFSMHSIHIPESFIPMKCCWSIGDQNCHSLDYRVEPSSCLYEKVHQVKLKYGSNHLAKNWGKKWIGLHRCFVYCQTHLGLLMSLLLPVSPWQRCYGPC